MEKSPISFYFFPRSRLTCYYKKETQETLHAHSRTPECYAAAGSTSGEVGEMFFKKKIARVDYLFLETLCMLVTIHMWDPFSKNVAWKWNSQVEESEPGICFNHLDFQIRFKQKSVFGCLQSDQDYYFCPPMGFRTATLSFNGTYYFNAKAAGPIQHRFPLLR